MLKRKKNKKFRLNIFDEEENTIIERSNQPPITINKNENKKEYDIFISFLIIIFIILIICLLIISILLFTLDDLNELNKPFKFTSNYDSINDLTQAQNITIYNVTNNLNNSNISSIIINNN